MYTEDSAEEFKERDPHVFNLQNEVTNLKYILSQERTNYQSLLREHELIKLEKDDFSRKYQAALVLGGATEHDVRLLLHNKTMSSTSVPLNTIGDVKEENPYCTASSHEQDNPLTLVRKQIAALKSQIKSLDEVRQSDSDDFRKELDYAAVETKKVSEEIRDVKALSLRLMKSKLDLLKKVKSSEQEQLKTNAMVNVNTTNDFELFEPERHSKTEVVKPTEKGLHRLKRELERTKNLLTEEENKVKESELKLCSMEKDHRRLKEFHFACLQQYDEKKDRLYSRIKVLEQRCEKDTQRRKREISGFHQDISYLRQFLVTLEKRVKSTIKKQTAETIRGKQGSMVCNITTCKSQKEGNVNLHKEKVMTSDIVFKPLNQESLDQLFQMVATRLAEIERKLINITQNPML